MLALTLEDECALRLIAQRFSHSPEEEQSTFTNLCNGFSLHGEAEEVAKYKTRKEYFDDIAQCLLENIGDAGKKTKDELEFHNLRRTLWRIVRGLGLVPDSDVEDVTQDVVCRALDYEWMESYNPTLGTLRNWLRTMIQNYVRTRYSREIRKVTHDALQLDGFGEEDQGGGSPLLCDNEQEMTGSLEEQLDTKEVIDRFLNDYLTTQPPFRVRVSQGFEYLCTVLPPGTQKLPVDRETTFFWLGGKSVTSRVTNWELHEQGISYKVPNLVVVDWICKDPVTGEQLIDEVTGEWVCQKYYPNPDYDPHAAPVWENRSLKEICLFLRESWQIDEIAQWYRTPPTSVPRWIERLEMCFLHFLKIDRFVPKECKHLASPSWKCPSCNRLWHQKRMNCSRCGCDMSLEMAAIRFDAYPWERPYATRATQVRLGNRRAPLEVMRSSLSWGDPQ